MNGWTIPLNLLMAEPVQLPYQADYSADKNKDDPFCISTLHGQA